MSSPDSGRTSTRIFFASANSSSSRAAPHECLPQRRGALRRRARWQDVGTAERLLAISKLDDLTIFRRFCEFDRLRHAQTIEHWIAGEIFLHKHANKALLEPIGTLAVHGVPPHAANTLQLISFDRDEDFPRARIAGDHAKFGAENIVQQHRRVAG